MTTDPKLKINLTGDDVNVFTKAITWVKGEQVEKTINLIDTDGLKSVSYSDIDNVKAIIFQSDSQFKIATTANAITSEVIVDGIFVLTPESTYWSTITDISISTDSITAISVNYRIYGAV